MNTDQKIDALYRMEVRRVLKDREASKRRTLLLNVMEQQFEQMPSSPMKALLTQLCQVFQALSSDDDNEFQERKSILGISSVEGDHEEPEEMPAPMVDLVQSYVQLFTGAVPASAEPLELPLDSPVENNDRTED